MFMTLTCILLYGCREEETLEVFFEEEELLISAYLEEHADNYSTPLTVETAAWGDVVRDCTATPCGPPDGTVGIATDVTALLDKFKNLTGAPIKARCDLEPSEPDMLINITDVTYGLDAFRGFGYPSAVVPETCPPAGGR